MTMNIPLSNPQVGRRTPNVTSGITQDVNKLTGHPASGDHTVRYDGRLSKITVQDGRISKISLGDGRTSKLRDIQRTPLPLPPVPMSEAAQPLPLHSIHNHHLYSNHQVMVQHQHHYQDVPHHPSHPHHHRRKPEMILLPSKSIAKNPVSFLPVCDLLFNLVSLTIYVCVILFNFLTIQRLYSSGDDNRHRKWYQPMLICLVLSSIVCQYLSYSWAIMEVAEVPSGPANHELPQPRRPPRRLRRRRKRSRSAHHPVKSSEDSLQEVDGDNELSDDDMSSQEGRRHHESASTSDNNPSSTMSSSLSDGHQPSPLRVETRPQPWVTLLHILQVGILWRYFRLFLPVNLMTVKSHVRDLSMLRMVQGFLLDGPILLMQVYMMLTKAYLDEITDLDVVSTCLSGVSISWALASFSKNVLRRNVHRLMLTWVGVIFQFVWRIGTISSRVVALSVYATIYHDVTLLVIFLHWTSMTLCYHLFGRNEDKSDDDGSSQDSSETRRRQIWPQVKSILPSVVIGWVYIFDYINLHETNSRPRMIAYYVTMFLENLLLSVVSLSKVRGFWFHHLSILVIFGGHFIGLISMILYYMFFHTKYIQHLNYRKCPQHNPHLRKSLVTGTSGSKGDLPTLSKAPTSNSSLPVGVFSCRLHPMIVAKRKKKMPSSFVLPPSLEGPNNHPHHRQSGQNLPPQVKSSSSKSFEPEVTGRNLSTTSVPTTHHRVMRASFTPPNPIDRPQGLNRPTVQSATLFGRPNYFRERGIDVGGHEGHIQSPQTFTKQVHVVVPHVRSKPDLLAPSDQVKSSVNVDDIQRQLCGQTGSRPMTIHHPLPVHTKSLHNLATSSHSNFRKMKYRSQTPEVCFGGHFRSGQEVTRRGGWLTPHVNLPVVDGASSTPPKELNDSHHYYEATDDVATSKECSNVQSSKSKSSSSSSTTSSRCRRPIQVSTIYAIEEGDVDFPTSSQVTSKVLSSSNNVLRPTPKPRMFVQPTTTEGGQEQDV